MVWTAALSAAALAGCVSTGGARPSTAAAPDQRPAYLGPERVASRAMAVWIAPWEDAQGNLHEATRVYAEVDPQRWSYPASGTDARMTVLRPLQVEPRTVPEATAAPPEAAPLAGAPAAPPIPAGARRGA